MGAARAGGVRRRAALARVRGRADQRAHRPASAERHRLLALDPGPQAAGHDPLARRGAQRRGEPARRDPRPRAAGGPRAAHGAAAGAGWGGRRRAGGGGQPGAGAGGPGRGGRDHLDPGRDLEGAARGGHRPADRGRPGAGPGHGPDRRAARPLTAAEEGWRTLPAGVEYRNFGRTGLKVSRLGLGCGGFGGIGSEPSLFGQGEDEATAFALMDRALELGINYLDTADSYGGGRSEEIVGRWLRARGTRHEVILSTKAGNRVGPGPNDAGLSRRHLMRALE